MILRLSKDCWTELIFPRKNKAFPASRAKNAAVFFKQFLPRNISTLLFCQIRIHFVPVILVETQPQCVCSCNCHCSRTIQNSKAKYHYKQVYKIYKTYSDSKKNIVHKNDIALFKAFEKTVMHNASYGKKPLKRKNCNEDNPENNGSHKHTKQRTKTQIVWNARKRNTNKKCNENSKQSTIFYARKNILKKIMKFR